MEYILIQSVIYILHFLVFRRFLCNWRYEQCRGWGEPLNITGAPPSDRGPGHGTDYITRVSVFPQPIETNPELFCSSEPFRFIINNFSGSIFAGAPRKSFLLVPKTILIGPHYGFCVSTLSIKNYYYDYYYISNFGNIVFSIINTVIVPVLAIAVESARVSPRQCDIYLPVYTYTLGRVA